MNIENQEIEKIELRSNEVQEILSRPPKWIIKWGITIILSVVIILLIGSWFFKYPDVINAEIILTTENPPASIVAKVSGKIQDIFIEDNDEVLKGDVLGILENAGDYISVELLQKELIQFKREFKIQKRINIISKNLKVGEIQENYSTFFKRVEENNNAIILNYHNQKIDLYNKELYRYGLYLDNLKRQNKILHEELELMQKQYSRDSILFSQALMSESDFEKSKSGLLSKLYNFEQNNISINNVEIQVESLNQSILELKLQQEQQFNNIESTIWESYNNLQAAIDKWKQMYLLRAPVNGKVTFNIFWSENQNVKSGDIVMTVVPGNEGEIIGKVNLGFDGAGKVKIGQKVNIQFNNYPYLEFGMIEGEVNSISLAPQNNYYSVDIKLSKGLRTFYGIDLEFKQEMKGKAEIITDDIRLLQRIVRPLRFILNKNTKFGKIKTS